MAKLPGTAQGRKRLLKLADLLEEDAANKKGIKFNLEVVCEPADLDPALSGTGGAFTEDGPTLDCRTAACAMGLAAISGRFKGLGYELNRDRNGKFFNIEVICTKKEGEKITGFEEAAQAYFEIPPEISSYLFIGDFYPAKYIKGRKGEQAVAKRIRGYVAGKKLEVDFE